MVRYIYIYTWSPTHPKFFTYFFYIYPLPTTRDSYSHHLPSPPKKPPHRWPWNTSPNASFAMRAARWGWENRWNRCISIYVLWLRCWRYVIYVYIYIILTQPFQDHEIKVETLIFILFGGFFWKGVFGGGMKQQPKKTKGVNSRF